MDSSSAHGVLVVISESRVVTFGQTLINTLIVTDVVL